MPRWLTRTLVVVAVLLVVGGGAYYWLIGDGDPPADRGVFALDIDALRAMADEVPGPKAMEIRLEKIAAFAFPAVAAVGGDGWDLQQMHAFSYQVLFPETSIVIDSALPASKGGSLGATVDDDAYARLDLALAAADQIVITHEHADHIGGIAAHPSPEVLRPRLRLTSEQTAGAGRYGAFSTPTPPLFEGYVPLQYETMRPIAPGVVLIKAPGHTPGSQMIYVQLDAGREYLFIGDIGWSLRNVATGKGRPRLMSDILLGEDRAAVFAQLAALRELHDGEPEIVVVPGHDSAAVDALIADGGLTEGFVL